MYESGDRSVTPGVAENIEALVAWRHKALLVGRQSIYDAKRRLGPPAAIALVWYETLEEWMSLPGREAILWRPQQSVIAALLTEEPSAHLVRFDLEHYKGWLGDRVDTESHRGAWASAQKE